MIRIAPMTPMTIPATDPVLRPLSLTVAPVSSPELTPVWLDATVTVVILPPSVTVCTTEVGGGASVVEEGASVVVEGSCVVEEDCSVAGIAVDDVAREL